MWRYLRQFPKFILAGLIIAASLAILFVWQARRAEQEELARFLPAQIKDTKVQEAQVAAKHDRLILVDNDLYDIDTGAVIFRHWLEKDMPQRLFYDGGTKKLIAQYQLGFVCYNLNGTVQATLLQQFKPAMSRDLKWMLYVKDKDIWRADIDWNEFKLVNERKITSIEQFWAQNFAENIFFWTDETLIVRNLNTLLRVNLETGDERPVRIPLEGITGRRSPDTRSLVGLQGRQFYCYDVDSDTAKTVPVGRGAINDYQWLGNDKCVAIASLKTVVLYDRPINALTVVAALPFPCFKIGDPSPDGRFAFCLDRGKWVLVDLKQNTATPVTGGAGICWVSNDTFAFSREVPDTELRGIWLQTAGEGERRVSEEPYLVNRAGPVLTELKFAEVVVFATALGLSKMEPDGTGLTEVGTLAHPPVHVLGIVKWKGG
jgi:hypothetical protein